MMIVQPEERNMYDQYWITKYLKESYPFMICFHILCNVENYNLFCQIPV
jgi:glutathione synthase